MSCCRGPSPAGLAQWLLRSGLVDATLLANGEDVYIGVGRRGPHRVFTVRARGGRGKFTIDDIERDFAVCRAKFPSLIACPVAAQTAEDGAIAIFCFEKTHEGVALLSQKHYRLVAPEEMSPTDLQAYRERPE